MLPQNMLLNGTTAYKSGFSCVGVGCSVYAYPYVFGVWIIEISNPLTVGGITTDIA